MRRYCIYMTILITFMLSLFLHTLAQLYLASTHQCMLVGKETLVILLCLCPFISWIIIFFCLVPIVDTYLSSKTKSFFLCHFLIIPSFLCPMLVHKLVPHFRSLSNYQFYICTFMSCMQSYDLKSTMLAIRCIFTCTQFRP